MGQLLGDVIGDHFRGAARVLRDAMGTAAGDIDECAAKGGHGQRAVGSDDTGVGIAAAGGTEGADQAAGSSVDHADARLHLGTTDPGADDNPQGAATLVHASEISGNQPPSWSWRNVAAERLHDWNPESLKGFREVAAHFVGQVPLETTELPAFAIRADPFGLVGVSEVADYKPSGGRRRFCAGDIRADADRGATRSQKEKAGGNDNGWK